MDSVSSSLSAIRAFGTKMEVTANNVANANSREFKKSRADLTEGFGGDVEVEISRVDTPGAIVSEFSDGEMIDRELSNVQLEEEMTQMIMTQRCYEANLEATKTKDEMLGTLVDIMS